MANVVSYVAEGYVALGYTVYTSYGAGAVSSNAIARLHDKTFGVCKVHGNQNGKITSCSSTVYANGIGVARITDMVTADCGHTGVIQTGSSKSFANGLGIARVGDHISGTYNASILEGSANTFSG